MTETMDTDLRNPSLYVNRELSLLRFHERVLAQTKDEATPLLERLRFLTISSAILDEFFEIRVAGLKEQAAFDLNRAGPDGLGPSETLSRIRSFVTEIVAEQYRVLNEVLLPAMSAEGIRILPRDQWNVSQAEWAADFFGREVEPVLTPMGLDPAHPFPKILNKSLNFLATLSGKDAFGRSGRVAVLQAPRLLPRVIQLPADISGAPYSFVLLSSLIIAHADRLFPGMKVTSCSQFRVTRNSDLWVEEEEVHDLLSALKGELPRRHYGSAVRIEITDRCPDEVVSFLLKQFELNPGDCYKVDGPVNLHRIEAILDLVDRADLRYPLLIPKLPRKLPAHSNLFAALRERDVLLHHPYQSFTPVLELVEQAASDPDVLAIKLTIYRTGLESPLAGALLRAAELGKEVTAVVELRARFDEAANIELASKLQEAGAKVVYGVVGFKAHCKLLMVVRREGRYLRRYCHLGTGNYNAKTARLYSDFGFLTSDEQIGEDVSRIFLQLTGLGRAGKLHKLVQTPFSLQDKLIALIDAEAENAKQGKKAHVMAKVNSLVDPSLMEALYRASMAGVPIDLIVRGTCCLRPDIPGVSENIRVRSILGRFLEHHRVFYFYNDGDPYVLTGSADWMPRNFMRRVEVCFPLPRKKLRQRVIEEGLEIFIDDNTNAWEMQSDGSYEKIRPREGEEPINAQEWLLANLTEDV
jgi:polyphosphate kinase